MSDLNQMWQRGAVSRVVQSDDEEVGAWAARCNIATQEALFSNICTAAEQPAEVVAERLGISLEDLEHAVSGQSDLTMTELRLIGIASDLIISYHVRSARRDYRKWVDAIGSSWSAHRTSDHHEEIESKGPIFDPAEYGQRVLRAGL
jgi:hypothetical protein